MARFNRFSFFHYGGAGRVDADCCTRLIAAFFFQCLLQLLAFADERFQSLAEVVLVLLSDAVHTLLKFLHTFVAVFARSVNSGLDFLELLFFFSPHFFIQPLQGFLAGIIVQICDDILCEIEHAVEVTSGDVEQ